MFHFAFLMVLLNIALRLGCGQALAGELDIFHSDQPFSIEKILPREEVYDLESIEGEELDKALAVYKKAWNEANSQHAKNLLGLALGFLQLKKGDARGAVSSFENRLMGNFVLEDLRIHFASQALGVLAESCIEKKEFSRAVKYLQRSIRLKLDLVRSYPASPLQETVIVSLAQVEKRLGDVYFKMANYHAAWQFYRRALMREFPNNAVHRAETNLSLARTYLAGGDLENASDLFVHLLQNFSWEPLRREIEDFSRSLESGLKARGKDTAFLEPLRKDYLVPRETARKNGKEGSPSKPAYSNETVRAFYNSLLGEDLDKIAETGYQVLLHYPGILEARGVVQALDEVLLKTPEGQPWISAYDLVLDLYPAEELSNLGLQFWRKRQSAKAAILYDKILSRYPLETQTCHKAAYFLGRIWEDKKEFDRALKYYNILLDRYDLGPYTPAAYFKTAWIERVRDKPDAARTQFQRLLQFYESPAFQFFRSNFTGADDFQTATLYWLVETESKLGHAAESESYLKKLVELAPFDFYSILVRSRLGSGLKGFLTQGSEPAIAYRRPGLGEVSRKRVSRAEKLISVGFFGFARHELEKVTEWRDDPAFQFYLAHLFNEAGGFQDSMRITWAITQESEYQSLSRTLSERLFPMAFFKKVKEQSEKNGMDAFLVLALMRQESAFNEKITSTANAVGLMQLLPSTADRVSVSLNRGAVDPEALTRPEINIPLGVQYLKRLLSRFHGNVIYALAAYNAGPTKVGEWIEVRGGEPPLEFIESIPYNETRGYVKKVLRNYAIYLMLYKNRDIRGINDLLTAGE
ncbi:MAG: hypothetical protein COV67_03475 [Nitrospinae bacterium CG11_big_fil_rev_8_21_14_0_20_56_8]|nr:MAG: hypothetical protein COV67_03475 [Nitrospinae bacterium CG11_big_fil_rev_8_21_14_0_20_56_8]